VIRSLALFTALLAVTFSSQGQPADKLQANDNEKQRFAENLDAFRQNSSLQETNKQLLMYGVDAFPCEKETADDQVHKKCLQARQAYYDYYAQGLTRRAKAYAWNNFSTRVIFVVVLSLVGIGIYFSWKQFFGMIMKPAVGEGAVPAKDAQLPITEFEAGLAGIKVKSPVLGVILLTVSLAFFYLYLRYVYPVTEGF